MKTRLHSSRMRTARSLTVSPSMLCVGECTWSGGVYLVWGGVPGPGDVPGLGGVPGPGGCTWTGEGVGGWVPGPGGVCTWSWGVPGPRGVYLVPGGSVPGKGCTWSWGCTWSRFWGVCLVLGSVPGPRGCTWVQGVYLVQVLGCVPGPGGWTWSQGIYLVPGGTWSWGCVCSRSGGVRYPPC